jgi:single-strand DNA-binding protein
MNVYLKKAKFLVIGVITMLNCVTLMGRLVADPDMRVTTTNKSVINFRIAVDRSYTKNGNREADFISIVAWESTADFVYKYFHKGDMIALQGSIQTRNYEDKDGNKRTAFEVVAKEVSFCGGKNENSSTDSSTKNNKSTDTSTVPGYSQMPTDDFEEIGDDEELPF